MLLQLKPLFMGEMESLPIDAELDFSGVEFQGIHPFTQPVRVKGRGRLFGRRGHPAGGGRNSGSTAAAIAATRRFKGPFRIPMEHILVASLNNEETDDFVLIDNYQLSLDELARADILLELPSKYLCREDCRGLCPMCGKNLNEGLCGCHTDRTDPRLEVLKQLIN